MIDNPYPLTFIHKFWSNIGSSYQLNNWSVNNDNNSMSHCSQTGAVNFNTNTNNNVNTLWYQGGGVIEQSGITVLCSQFP